MSFKLIFLNTDTFYFQVAVVGEKFVSTVKVFVRTAWYEGKEIKVGGFGEVGTHPEWRSKGLSTKCLEVS